jgi:predicted O-methyltransferase YrrM
MFIIARNLKNKIKRFFYKYKYKENFFKNHQSNIFSKFNLNRNLGLLKIKNIKTKYKFLSSNKMSSEHETFFASISLNSSIKIKKILEIGTFDGKNAFLLSLLFEDAKVETIDLKKNDDNFKNFYNRKNQINKFTNLRNNFLSKNKKIIFKEFNSIHLYNSDKKYDLIWIDGAHGYPVVSMDIINSLRLINKNGIIMCDDIYVNKIKSDKMYNSNAAIETLTELKNENIINFDLIYKRLDCKNNSDINKRKFIAIIKKM